MIETEAVMRHVHAKLIASSPLQAHISTRVYEGAAPQGATFPYAVIQLVDATDVRYAGSDIPRNAFMTVGFDIKVVDQADTSANVYAAMEDAHSAVQVFGTQTGWHIYCPVRQQTVKFEQFDSGKRYITLVSTYSCIVSAL
jgi:hypothetical protein